MHIAVCDVGLGNLRSVERALLTTGASGLQVSLTKDPEQIARADKVVMPGQGAFGDCARALDTGLGEAVREAIARGTPYLGICLGLQVLFRDSDEAPGARGLSVFPGRVAKLTAGTDTLTGEALKIPHVGWNEAAPAANRGLLPAHPTHFYFVHSYVVVPDDATIVAATTEYGAPFASAVAKDNVFACQFHPEKSQKEGLALLARFVESR